MLELYLGKFHFSFMFLTCVCASSNLHAHVRGQLVGLVSLLDLMCVPELSLSVLVVSTFTYQASSPTLKLILSELNTQ